MKSHNPATLPDPDPIQRPVKRIQGIEKGFRFSFPAISPKALCHFVQGLDGALNFSSSHCFAFLLYLRHLVTLLQGIILSFNG
jgi:hypothetical protein